MLLPEQVSDQDLELAIRGVDEGLLWKFAERGREALTDEELEIILGVWERAQDRALERM